MRSAALFAIFGAVAALVQAFGQELALGETLESALLWGLGFGLLGWGIGRAARAIAREALPGEAREPGAPPADEREDERSAWVRPSERRTGVDTPPPAGPRGRDRRRDAQKV